MSPIVTRRRIDSDTFGISGCWRRQSSIAANHGSGAFKSTCLVFDFGSRGAAISRHIAYMMLANKT